MILQLRWRSISSSWAIQLQCWKLAFYMSLKLELFVQYWGWRDSKHRWNEGVKGAKSGHVVEWGRGEVECRMICCNHYFVLLCRKKHANETDWKTFAWFKIFRWKVYFACYWSNLIVIHILQFHLSLWSRIRCETCNIWASTDNVLPSGECKRNYVIIEWQSCELIKYRDTRLCDVGHYNFSNGERIILHTLFLTLCQRG
jgi:hypothetical protein